MVACLHVFGARRQYGRSAFSRIRMFQAASRPGLCSAGVVYNDVNSDGKRQVLLGGRGGEGGVPNAVISMYVLSCSAVLRCSQRTTSIAWALDGLVLWATMLRSATRCKKMAHYRLCELMTRLPACRTLDAQAFENPNSALQRTCAPSACSYEMTDKNGLPIPTPEKVATGFTNAQGVFYIQEHLTPAEFGIMVESAPNFNPPTAPVRVRGFACRVHKARGTPRPAPMRALCVVTSLVCASAPRIHTRTGIGCP